MQRRELIQDKWIQDKWDTITNIINWDSITPYETYWDSKNKDYIVHQLKTSNRLILIFDPKDKSGPINSEIRFHARYYTKSNIWYLKLTNDERRRLLKHLELKFKGRPF